MLITDKQFRALTAAEGKRCVSVYLPSSGEKKGAMEGKKRFAGLLDEAKSKLIKMGLPEEDAGQFLQQGYELQKDQEFWLTLKDGLAVFISEGEFEHYVLPIEVLFLRNGDQEWGIFKNGTVEFREKQDPESIDLMDVAAVQTYLHGGKVFQVEPEDMPRPAAKMNAIFG